MAVKKGVKKKEGEKLTPQNIEKVIGLLEQQKPITKKEACEILNISYNTTRLGKIIEEYKAETEQDNRRRKANRGKPAQDHEIQSIVRGALDNDSIKSIADNLYRSPSFVKEVISRFGIPERGEGYFDPALLPEQCMADEFKYGEIVWSARYEALAIIVGMNNDGTYRIFVIETIEDREGEKYVSIPGNYGGQHADQPVSELGSLEHFKALGVDIYRAYKQHFPKWLGGDFSGLYGTKKWQSMLESGAKVYSC